MGPAMNAALQGGLSHAIECKLVMEVVYQNHLVHDCFAVQERWSSPLFAPPRACSRTTIAFSWPGSWVGAAVQAGSSDSRHSPWLLGERALLLEGVVAGSRGFAAAPAEPWRHWNQPPCPPTPPAATVPWVLLPGLVAYTLPAFYERRREPVIVASKLACAASYPLFRLSWHAPGTPLDVRAAFGSFLRLPVHPMAVLQCGAVGMMGLSIRHSLRFKAQLLCQLAMLAVAMQAEAVSGLGAGVMHAPSTAARRADGHVAAAPADSFAVRHRCSATILCQHRLRALPQAAHRTAASPQQHFLSLRNATLLQLVCGTLWPLVQHYQFDCRRRKVCQQAHQRQQFEQQQRQQQQQWAEELPQQAPGVQHASGPVRQRQTSATTTTE